MKYDLDEIASYLIATVPAFADGKLALYTGVNAANILRNGIALIVHSEKVNYDLLVCVEEQIVLEICFNEPSEEMYESHLKMLPFVWMPEEDDMLPFQESCGEEPPLEYMRSMCEQVSRKLSALERKKEGLHTYRRRATGIDPQCGTLKYTLPALPAQKALERVQIGQEDDIELLIRKRFLQKSGIPTAYGMEKGLFLCYRIAPSGAICREVMTTSCMLPTILASLCWKGGKGECSSLKDRLKILKDPDFTGGEYAIPALKELLNCPLERVFRNRPASLQKLRGVLLRAGHYLAKLNNMAEAEMQIRTYRDCLAFTRVLWEQLREDCWYDNTWTANLHGNCEQLLLLLAEPFLFEQPPVVLSDKPKGKQSLRTRIDSVRTEFAVASIPIMHYYYAAACIVGSDYPNWLYKRKIYPLFEGDKRPESAFDLRILAQHGHNLHENKAVEDWKETFPFLFSLLVDPIVGNTKK